MSKHIEAGVDEIAKVVLMPGDPRRARAIATSLLEDAKLVNTIRSNDIWTGTFKGERITVAASGMGLGSIGIYSHELFLDYDVDCIIRIGTAGSYNEELEVGQLVMARESFCYSSEFNMLLLGEEVANRHLNQASREVNVLIADTARNLDIDLKETRFHTTEVFYTKGKSIESLRAETGAELVEMESFALFATAESLNKRAATICAISDNIVTNEGMDASTRERGLKLLFRLALESAFEVSLRLKEGSF